MSHCTNWDPSQPSPFLNQNMSHWAPSQPSPFAFAFAPRGPCLEFPVRLFDHYTRRILCFVDHRRVLLGLQQLSLPCDLVRAAMFFHAQLSHQPPPRLPRYMRLQFLPHRLHFSPLQLQRFLRSCVLATAHALVTPPASVFVHARTKSRCIDCISVRVMSGFVARAEVRRQGARCACACRAALARLSSAISHIVWSSFH
jgi:hypothetical protein